MSEVQSYYLGTTSEERIFLFVDSSNNIIYSTIYNLTNSGVVVHAMKVGNPEINDTIV